jgi:hypothetical protein
MSTNSPDLKTKTQNTIAGTLDAHTAMSTGLEFAGYPERHEGHLAQPRRAL